MILENRRIFCSIKVTLHTHTPHIYTRILYNYYIIYTIYYIKDLKLYSSVFDHVLNQLWYLISLF